MRDILLVLTIAISLALTLRFPFVGVLVWTWFTCNAPHQQVFGFSHSIPMNLVIAIVTLGAILFSEERKVPQGDGVTIAVFAFLAWMTFNGLFAANPSWSWPLWDRDWRVIILGVLVGALATSRVRIHALLWTIVVSLFYYGVKGGLFTLFTGGHFRVVGPPDTIISDNNQLALALLMVLPLANYLRLQSASRIVSYALAAGMALTIISVLGSYSRGAYVALAVLGLFALMRSRRKIRYLFWACAVIVPTLYLMPQSFYDRVNSLSAPGQDEDFVSRLRSWTVAFDYARDHFPLGAGISGTQLPRIYNHYFPTEQAFAAHSIYFQVLGDNGFAGLLIYLTVIGLAFVYAIRIRNLTKGHAHLGWASDLALMLQLALIAYCAGGSALSMAYYDLFYLSVGLLSALLVLIHADIKQAKISEQSPMLDTRPLIPHSVTQN